MTDICHICLAWAFSSSRFKPKQQRAYSPCSTCSRQLLWPPDDESFLHGLAKCWQCLPLQRPRHSGWHTVHRKSMCYAGFSMVAAAQIGFCYVCREAEEGAAEETIRSDLVSLDGRRSPSLDQPGLAAFAAPCMLLVQCIQAWSI